MRPCCKPIYRSFDPHPWPCRAESSRNFNLMILRDTVDKQGPQPCCRTDCDDSKKPTERYGVTLMMYSMDRSINIPIQAHLGLQVCKDCQTKLNPQDFVTNDFIVMFRVATSKSELPATHPCRILDPARTKIAWRELGRYTPTEAASPQAH